MDKEGIEGVTDDASFYGKMKKDLRCVKPLREVTRRGDRKLN